jgi:endonuclease-3
VNRIAASTTAADPFRILISTIISLRTRDEVTFAASDRLLARAATPAEMAQLDTEEIARLIYPAGFYRNKARQISEICVILTDQYAGVVPATREELTAFPGVGRKTANLVLGLGFGVPAICVDIHVHRIPNRLGWISTTTPEQSESALMEIVPPRFWIPMNQWLVGFGQRVCTPRGPRCSVCPFSHECPKIGVSSTR